MQDMEERCSAMAEDHQKLAVSNRQLAEENKRLQEVLPETLLLPDTLGALLEPYQGLALAGAGDCKG